MGAVSKITFLHQMSEKNVARVLINSQYKRLTAHWNSDAEWQPIVDVINFVLKSIYIKFASCHYQTITFPLSSVSFKNPAGFYFINRLTDITFHYSTMTNFARLFTLPFVNLCSTFF